MPVEDIRDEQVLFARGKLACKKCAKDLKGLLLAPQRTPFAAIRDPGAPRSGGGVLIALAVIVAGGALFYAFTQRKGGEAAPDAQAAGKTSKDLTRALALVAKPPESFEQAKAVLDEVRALAAGAKGDLELEGPFRRAVERATLARDGFAPGLASSLLEQAALEFKKAEHAEESLAVLSKFPEELLGTAAGSEVAAARERYEALAMCRRRGGELLQVPSPNGFMEMDQLMGTPEAQKSGFAATDVGKQVEIERRRRRNSLASLGASAAVHPPESYDAVIAGWCEWRNDLVEAESRYRFLLSANKDLAEANVGLARIYLERERLDLARPYYEAARAVALNRADMTVLDAWFVHLAPDPDSWYLAGKVVNKVPNGALGRYGRRLRWILSLKKPVVDQKRTRIVGDFSKEELGDVPLQAETTAETAARALGVGAGHDRMDVLLFKDEASRRAFIKNLELRKETAEGVLVGCFAVAPIRIDLAAVRLAVAAGLARRAPAACPEWLTVALPRVLAARSVGVNAKMKLQDLERLDAARVLANEDALTTAEAYASLAATEDGQAALAAYVAARAEGAAPKARDDLEAVFKRLVPR